MPCSTHKRKRGTGQTYGPCSGERGYSNGNTGGCDDEVLRLEHVMANEAVSGEAQIRDELDEEVIAIRVDWPEHGHSMSIFKHFNTITWATIAIQSRLI